MLLQNFVTHIIDHYDVHLTDLTFISDVLYMFFIALPEGMYENYE